MKNSQKGSVLTEALNQKGRTQVSNQESPEIIEALLNILGTNYALYVKTQNFHWNVTGPLFYPHHLLLEKQYQELLLEIDEMAERVRTLGFFVPASLAEFKKLSAIDEAEGKVPDAETMIQTLADDHEILIKQMKAVIPVLEDAGDDATMDFITGCVEAHEKTAWMLKSSL